MQDYTISSENNSDRLVQKSFFNLILKLCIKMREENIAPLVSEIRIIYQDDYIYTYHKKLSDPSFFEERLYKELKPYLNRALKRRTCIKKITLSFSHFTAPFFQANLFHDAFRILRLTRAFDLIQKRFGKKYIHYGL